MDSIINVIDFPEYEDVNEFFCGDGTYLRKYNDQDFQTFELFCKIAESSGFKLADSTDIENNFHRSYIGKIRLHIYFCKNEKVLRVIYDPNTEMYPVKPVISRKFKTVLWQFEVDHSLIDCGMFYAVRCDDGSFFVIDSGHMYSVNDDIRIIEFLKKMSGEEKPRIAAWFVSHAHDDHISKLSDILEYHKSELNIEMIYCNILDIDGSLSANWNGSDKNAMHRFLNLLESRTDIKKIKLHTGMHFFVRNLEFWTLCTHEDVYPNPLNDFNDTSTALMMECDGTKVLFPGDCAIESDKVLISRYKDFLKCDIVQISHHGHRGTSPEFYRRANAQCALFPITDIKFREELPRQESNRTAIELSKEYYIASNGTVEIPIPYHFGETKVYPDETFEDFNGIYNLWGYEYTDEYKNQLIKEYEERQA